MENERSSLVTIGGEQYEMVLTTRATNYYAPYPSPTEGAFYFAGECKAIAVCPGVSHGQDIVAENSAFLQQKYL